MDALIVKGKRKLDGKIVLPAAKNAVLPLLALTVACEDEIVLKDCEPLSDVNKMLEIINYLGGTAYFSGGDVYVCCKNALPREIDERFTGEIRSSIFLLGPVLARFRYAEMCYPGGCDIGLRPIDLHIEGLRRLGVKISEIGGKLVCDGENMHAADVYLDFPSVGATENLIMASVFLPGRTIIRNAAMEPEIRDLAAFINMLGGKVYGAGTDTVCVEGVKRLMGGIYRPVPDRIVAGTYIAALAICGGKIAFENYRERDMKAVEAKFRQSGVGIVHRDGEAEFFMSDALRPVRKTETHPFPGFPTDMQPQLTVALCYAKGLSIVVENLFESRFRYTRQLQKAGADITVKDCVAVIKGKGFLTAADMQAEDLRGGAAIILAALGAEGESRITGLKHVDRGYYKIENGFTALGADVKRETVELKNNN